MSNLRDPEEKEGVLDKSLTTDLNTHELLNEILKQIKITNLHLSLISGDELDKKEL